jgi:hypothetical protein
MFAITLCNMATKKKAKPTKLSKADPDYFRKIGKLSAKKRKKTTDYSALAKASHPRKSYNGGRPKTKEDGSS